MPHSNVSHPEMILKSATMADLFTPEKLAYIFSLIPTPESYTELHNRMEANYPAALRGDPEKVKEFEADRKAVNLELSLIHGLAKLVAVKDPTVPETLGLGVATEKSAPATISLTGPRDFKVVYDPEGHLMASVTRVPGAKGYQVWACEGDPNVEANWRLAASSSNCRGIVIAGLNRGKSNVLKIRAMRGNDAGPWSNWVSLQPS